MNKKIWIFAVLILGVSGACILYFSKGAPIPSEKSASTENPREVDDLNKPMEFRRANNSGHCGDACNWISATGIIDETTPERFRKFIGEMPEDFTKKNYTLGRVSLNSPGGNLIAGMQLGTLMREYKASTEIGETHKNAGGHDEQGSGICASACAYAFLGGISRNASAGELGFHQFYNDSKTKGEKLKKDKNFSDEQVASGVIAAYLSEMGVDSKVLTVASFTRSDSLFFPTDEELIAFGIVTGEDEEFRPWRVESVAGGLKAYTVRNSVTMASKAVGTYCINSNGNAFFEIITDRTIDPAAGSEAIILGQTIQGVTFTNEDKSTIVIPSNEVLTNVNEDSYSVAIPLNSGMKSSILSGKFNVSIDAPRSLYDGWVVVYFDLTAQDIQNIGLAWNNCIKV
ncbi:MAG: hypothetical protein K9G62_06120 [Alphaproteobacteria bacterium]|nr:hypothetical protein [Alphaproteobacteria bacterium]